MRKLKIRWIVGFPLGIFVGYTFIIFYNLLSKGSLTYFETFNLTAIPNINTIIQYFMLGIIGILSISLSTMFENLEWTIIKQVLIHTIITTVNELFICSIGNVIHNNQVTIIFVFITYLIILILCNLIVFKRTNDFVTNLNNQLKNVKELQKKEAINAKWI